MKRVTKSNPAVVAAIAAQRGKTEVPDILQFACGGYYCAEGDPFIEVKIERLGNPDGHASVEYYTVDGSAKAGVKFKSTSGVAKFTPQQTEFIVRIELLQDDNFDSVLEFNAVLANPIGAALDCYLKSTEITIADDDNFPTNRVGHAHRNAHPGKGHHQLTESLLLREYIRMHMQDKKLWRQTLVTVFYDQIENFELVWNLFLARYLIDYILVPPELRDNGKKTSVSFFQFMESFDVKLQIWLYVVFLIVPGPIKWVLTKMKANRRMGGKSRMRLQENLMRKFLNYNQMSRSQMSNADLTMSITRDVPDCVHNGLLMIFPIMKKISLLIMYGVMAVRNQVYTGIYFVAFPILMIGFLWIRLAKTEEATHDLHENQTRMVAFVQKVTDFFRMIADYGQKQETVQHFHDTVKNFNDSMHHYHSRQVTNFAFAPLLTNIFVGLYIVMFYQQVRDPDGGMAVGQFLTGIGIWKGVGSSYQGLYENMLTIQDSLSSLHNICFYMNLPLDILDRKKNMSHLLQELDKAQDASSALFYEGKATDCSLVQATEEIISGDIVERAGYSQDLIQIDCQDVSFTWPSHGNVPQKQVLVEACFEISQGSLVGVTGSAGSGKATLLQLLAGVLVPSRETGLLFVPPHLRLLHVTCEPIIFYDCTLWDNLVYGECSEDDRNPERVLDICRRLGLSDDVLNGLCGSNIATINTTDEKGTSMCHTETIGTGDSVATRDNAQKRARTLSSVSHTDRVLLHLARALVVNPDLLILHKPLTQFHSVDVQRVLEVFRTFVDMRGLEQPLETRHLRRPRTCVMSLASLEILDAFDLILQIADGSVQEVDVAGVDDLQKDTKRIIHQIDADNNGYVGRDEFTTEVMKDSTIASLFDLSADVIGESPEVARSKLESVFDSIDFAGGGLINCDEMSQFLRSKIAEHAPKSEKVKRMRQMRQSRSLRNSNRGKGAQMEVEDVQGVVWEGQTPVPDEGAATLDTLSQRLSLVPQTAPTPGYRSNWELPL